MSRDARADDVMDAADPSRELGASTRTSTVWHYLAYAPSLQFGMSDDEFVDYASSLEPRSRVLARLRERDGWDVGLHLLTTGRTRSERRPPLEIPIVFHQMTAGCLLSLAKAWPALYNRLLPQIMSLRLTRAVLLQPPDLLVFRGNMFSRASHRLARQLSRRGIPYIYENHGAEIVVSPQLRPFIRGAAAIIALTREVERAFVEGYGLPPSKVKVISNGVATDHFEPRGTPSASAYPTLAFVGRLSHEKGFDIALASFVELSKRWPNATLEVAGKPLPETEAFARATLAAVPAEIKDRIKLHGWLKGDALINLYSRSDALLFPSRVSSSGHGEGEPRAVLEGMSCGAPIVAVAGSGGHCEIIVSSGVGRLARQESEFAEVVVALMEQRERMARDREAARAFILRDYSIDAVYAQYRSCCLEALEARPHVT